MGEGVLMGSLKTAVYGIQKAKRRRGWINLELLSKKLEDIGIFFIFPSEFV